MDIDSRLQKMITKTVEEAVREAIPVSPVMCGPNLIEINKIMDQLIAENQGLKKVLLDNVLAIRSLSRAVDGFRNTSKTPVNIVKLPIQSKEEFQAFDATLSTDHSKKAELVRVFI